MDTAIFSFLTLGLVGYFIFENSLLSNLAVGIIVFSLGLSGFLIAAIEMFEKHRRDKNPKKSRLKDNSCLQNL